MMGFPLAYSVQEQLLLFIYIVLNSAHVNTKMRWHKAKIVYNKTEDNRWLHKVDSVQGNLLVKGHSIPASSS